MYQDFSEPSTAVSHSVSLSRFVHWTEEETSPHGLKTGMMTLNKPAAQSDKALHYRLAGTRGKGDLWFHSSFSLARVLSLERY